MLGLATRQLTGLSEGDVQSMMQVGKGVDGWGLQADGHAAKEDPSDCIVLYPCASLAGHHVSCVPCVSSSLPSPLPNACGPPRPASLSPPQQEELEAGLHFSGLAVMVNPLRGDTTAVIAQLHDADIRTVMVTGDHARTAVSVALNCGMLCQNRPVAFADTSSAEGRVEDSDLALTAAAADGSELPGSSPDELMGGVAAGSLAAAVTGRGFEKVRSWAEGTGGVGQLLCEVGLCWRPTTTTSACCSCQHLLLPPLTVQPWPSFFPPCTTVQLQELGAVQPFLERAGVYARMSPDDKRTLMELLGDGSLAEDGAELPGLGQHVGFCGDGANDVGALKGAHVGVSLCEAEASVAAPLTSKRQTIACVLTVIAEGRCSLITSYIIFKFIIVYAFIQVGSGGCGRAGGRMEERDAALRGLHEGGLRRDFLGPGRERSRADPAWCLGERNRAEPAL